GREREKRHPIRILSLIDALLGKPKRKAFAAGFSAEQNPPQPHGRYIRLVRDFIDDAPAKRFVPGHHSKRLAECLRRQTPHPKRQVQSRRHFRQGLPFFDELYGASPRHMGTAACRQDEGKAWKAIEQVAEPAGSSDELAQPPPETAGKPADLRFKLARRR